MFVMNKYLCKVVFVITFVFLYMYFWDSVSYATSVCQTFCYVRQCPGVCGNRVAGRFCSQGAHCGWTNTEPPVEKKWCNCWNDGCCVACDDPCLYCGEGCPPDPTCFVAGTGVTMEDGSEKDIEDVAVGDKVLSFDKNGNQSSYEVLELESPIREGYYIISLENGTSLEITNEHPVFYKNKGYEGWGSMDPEVTEKYSDQIVQQIVVDGYFFDKDSTWLKIKSIIFVPMSIQTYNLKKVDGASSFFANGIWVHNKGEECAGGTPSVPANLSPANQTVGVDPDAVTLSWGGVAAWGEVCDNETRNNHYEVYISVDDSNDPANSCLPVGDASYSGTTVSSDITSWNASNFVALENTGYCWYIKASNGPRSSYSSVNKFVTECVISFPSVPAGLLPVSGTVDVDKDNIIVSWGGVSSWGEVCNETRDNHYEVYTTVDDSNDPADACPAIRGGPYTNKSGSLPYNTSSWNASSSVTLSDTGYCWYILASNGPRGSLSSVNKFVTECLTSPPSTPTGLLPVNKTTDVDTEDITLSWNAVSNWGEVCAETRANTYILYITVDDSNDPADACPTAGSSYYGESLGATSWDASGFVALPNTGYCWYIQASNGPRSSYSSINKFITYNPLLDQNWFTALGGDVFSGSGINIEFPEVFVADWDPVKMGYTVGSVVSSFIANGNISPGGDDITEDNTWAKMAGFSEIWPASYETLNVPTHSEVVAVTSCSDFFNSDIDASKIYSASSNCIRAALANSGGNYSVSGDGIAIVYVDGYFTIESDLVPVSSSDGLILVSNDGISITSSSSFGVDLPTKTWPPNLDLAIISDRLAFTDNGTDTDLSIIVNGVYMAKDLVLNRNRGPDNIYPAEIFKYDYKYMYAISKMEREHPDILNFTGLSTIDIDWSTGEE